MMLPLHLDTARNTLTVSSVYRPPSSHLGSSCSLQRVFPSSSRSPCCGEIRNEREERGLFRSRLTPYRMRLFRTPRKCEEIFRIDTPGSRRTKEPPKNTFWNSRSSRQQPTGHSLCFPLRLAEQA